MLDKLSAKDCMVGWVARAKFVAEWVVVLAKERALWAVAEAVADTEDVTSDTSTLWTLVAMLWTVGWVAEARFWTVLTVEFLKP